MSICLSTSLLTAAKEPQKITIGLIIETADPEASVEVVINGLKTGMNSLKLEYGENIIKIKIISRDKKYSRTLTVSATRAPAAWPAVLPTALPTISLNSFSKGFY